MWIGQLQDVRTPHHLDQFGICESQNRSGLGKTALYLGIASFQKFSIHDRARANPIGSGGAVLA